MEKTKCWLFIFVLIFAAVIAGSVAILNVADNQTIDDFELEMVEGSDPTVIDGIGFNVEYGLSEGTIEKNAICKFNYVDGKIKELQFSEKEEPERRGEGEQPWEMFEQYEYISDNRVFAIHESKEFIQFWVAEFNDTSEYDLPTAKVIEIAIPEDFYKEEGGFRVDSEKYMWTVNDDVYFFENGCLCRVSKAELMELSTERIDGNYATGDSVFYAPIYTVPDEIETIIGCKGGELIYITGIGDVTIDGYNLYTYIVDPATGETIDRQCYEKKLSVELAEANQLRYDYLAKDSYSILTITQPTGYQDMFVIERTDSQSKIHNLNVSDLLSENFYISGLLETEHKGNDTLYLIYAEGQINKLDYDANWSRRVIMNLEERLPVECPLGYNIWEVGYNGIAFIAIQNGEVVYKGYFASETSKAMGYTINSCMENGQYGWDLVLPKAYVEQITISVPQGGNADE